LSQPITPAIVRLAETKPAMPAVTISNHNGQGDRDGISSRTEVSRPHNPVTEPSR